MCARDGCCIEFCALKMYEHDGTVNGTSLFRRPFVLYVYWYSYPKYAQSLFLIAETLLYGYFICAVAEFVSKIWW